MNEPFIEHCELYEDDRGSVYCAMDDIGLASDISRDDLGSDGAKVRKNIKRTYVIKNWSKGMIRAWHGHLRGWTGLHVIKGSAKILAKRITGFPLITQRFVLSDRKPGIVWIPPGWYNGHMSLEDDTRILVYSTQTFEEVKGDDVRCGLTQSDVEDWFEVLSR